MKLLIDARKLQDGGIGRYINNLLNGLYEYSDISPDVIVQDGTLFSEYNKWSKRFKIITSQVKKYSLKEQFFALGNNYDLFHVPHYTLPYFTNCRTVITVHDLIHLQCPEKWYYPYVAKPLILSALYRASKIITVSDFSKKQLLSISPKITDKIKVIPNAIADIFKNVEETKEKTYLLAIFSNTKPHKGFNDLIEAFKIAKEKVVIPKLLIAGMGTKNIKNLPEGVEVVGEVSDEKLKDLYSKAIAVVVPSLLEGFCLQILESHICNTRVIARPVECLLELMTKEDIVCKDLSIPALAEAISLAIRQRSLPQRINFNFENYSIKKTTENTVKVYESCLSS